MSLDAKRYCAHCHTYDGHPLSDCDDYAGPENEADLIADAIKHRKPGFDGPLMPSTEEEE